MEESTENHMETDVSSTTDDVPETQEVTGSDGNVEMIIVVEKMDDESTADDQSDEHQSPVHEGTDSIMTPEDKAPEKEQVSTVKLPLKSPVKSPIKTPTVTLVKSPARSPIKSPANTPVKSPAKSPVQSPAKSPLKSPTKSPTIDAEIVNSTEDTEIVMIVETAPQVPDEVSAPVATQQVEVTVEASPIKESPVNETEDKPTQILSPSKEVPVPKSPNNELQPSDSARSTPTKETITNDKTTVNGKVQSNETSKMGDTNVKTIATIAPIEITIENSNDSQIETLSDISEKEHKGISRELKSLIKSAKESKIISECTQLKSKTRKSRSALDTSSSSLNSSLLEPGKIHDTRRNSDNSQKSNCSEKSDKTHLKRSMRSQNPEFVSKVKQFLNSVTGKSSKDSDDEDDVVESKDKSEILEQDAKGTPPKVKKSEPIVITENSNKLRSDPYCWRCHWAVEHATNEKMHPPMHCTVCPRTFHYKCLTGPEKSKINVEKNWVCPECMIVLQAESSETRSPAMKKISLGMLCDLLKHALRRMTETNGVEPFMQPVDRTAFPDYDKYVVHPMDLSLMRDNISEGLYGSTEAFLADAQWILHNSIIFNTHENVCPPSVQSKLTAGARALVRSCRSEMGEIEACPECYAAAHARRPTWFTDVCSTPHILFWAKLKGFPFWPAKGMSVNSSGLVDVRFFGAHDRAWVPSKDCFLYSEKDPNNFRTKRQDIIDSMQEAEQHIRNISRKYGRFVYPPFKTPFEPSRMSEQLKMMIPTFEGDVRSLVKEKPSPAVKGKSRSNSKGSKCSLNDGLRLHSDSTDSGSDGEELQRLYALLDKYSDASETEDAPALPARKMADGAEIAKVEEDESNVEKEVEVEVPVKLKENTQTPTSTTSRKRRRSDLEEAVITIIETSGSYEKRSRRKSFVETKKPDALEPTSSKVVDTTTDKPKGETNKTTPKQTTPVKANETLTKLKDSEPTSSTEKEKTQRVTPIRIALVKERRHSTRTSSSKDPTAKIITPNKDKEQEKTTPQRPKSARSVDKTSSATKPEKTKPEKVDKTPNAKAEKGDKTPNDKTTRGNRSRAEKRSSSRSSRSTNSTSSTRSSDKAEKKSDGKAKDKSKESKPSAKEKDKDGDANKSTVVAQMSPKPVPDVQSPKSVKDRLHFDDNTTLAVLARETPKSNNLVTVTLCNNSGLPTISSVRSLSTTAQATGVTITKTTTNATTIDITEESSTSDSSIFTPTSSENVTSMKEAMSKLQRLRNDTTEPVVGRVGVRAFARMTSPERHTPNEEVQVEIKAEPIDLDDPERHNEKMDLMNAFRLRPVNPQNVPAPTMNLRDVRINKVVVTPLNAKKVTKPPEVRPRAKKSFPQPKKTDESRSDLVTKNSMVYIPIQPPMTQAPSARPPRPPHAATPTVQPIIRPPIMSTSANSLVNTVTTPLMLSSPCISTSGVTNSTSVATVPTVHTVPLMTSVNGQWMFSFQPVMSVGAIDNTPASPLVNGITDRSNTSVPLATLTPTSNSTLVSSVATPAASVVPVLPAATPAPPISVLSRTPTDNTPGETLSVLQPPRLQQRPTQCLQNPLDCNTPIGTMPPPSTAGPVTAKLNQNAVKMTDFFRSLLEDSLEKLDEPVSQLTTLKLQLEQDKWRHQQEIKELKHNYELTIAEMRASFEKEKLRAVSEARRASQVELETAVKQTKTKQWCANCSQEAQFYCCWNTAYCGYPCQRAHWAQHFSACQQQRQDGSNGESPTSPKSLSDNMPKTPAPTLTVGGKVAPSRAFNQDPNSAPKTSIIVSMVEDTSGNQTMKCVGTYKPVSGNQLAPMINNIPTTSNEENQNKKVVSSSGGYLIVGGASNSSVVTPARRTHAIQYFS
ncbi:protein kinase C-binding protein 1-like isoform X2 [Spodoptera litura]|uniref:Protein kinase C-binding protein 1-like isoform X2 n=1 Tax=Spodoptera litura TaxID=69820 RepID=A0A9J7DX48_SPOLT|nr:protein kinase C-binding protein 1-like isoform X2 [Spodoptera litura]